MSEVGQSAEKAQVEELAHDLLRAKHDDNPDAPFPMVRAGCADILAEALYDLGWRCATPSSGGVVNNPPKPWAPMFDRDDAHRLPPVSEPKEGR